MQFAFRRQILDRDSSGCNIWRPVIRNIDLHVRETALLICDMWDNHWSRGAVIRVNEMVPRMNDTIKAARDRGIQIIHSPSDVIEFYGNSPARQRVLDVPPVEPPASKEHIDYPLPIDDSDDGSDTGETLPYVAWARQHHGIEIDEDLDIISADGREIYSFMSREGIRNLLVMGVHTNMCVLNRSFGIKQMVRWGINTALVRDLTDTMYNPARSPYVSHEEGTRLVVEYIEKFWCPTISSQEIMR